MTKKLMIFTAAAWVIALAGCVISPEGGWEFAPVDAAKVAAQKVSEIPDEVKANVLEMLALALGGTGAGIALSGAAGYYRRRADAKKAAAESEQESGSGGDLQNLAKTCGNLHDDGLLKDESEV